MTDREPTNNFSQLEDHHFKSIMGVDRRLFDLLLHRLDGKLKSGRKLEKHQKLELFFTLLKLNISFVNLGALFNVCDSVARRVFYEVLELVYEEVKPLVYWPSKEKTQARMPPLSQSSRMLVS